MATKKNPKDQRTTLEQVTVRRSPRYLRFFILGLVAGVMAALILTVSFPEVSQYSTLQVFGFLLLVCCVLAGALGLVVALIFDRAFASRTRRAEAEHTTVGD